MYFLLKMYEHMLQIAKKKNIAAGFFPGRTYLMIGNKRITKAQDAQFAAVASDSILGCATSGK